ncbi:allantoate permease [Melanogaster broomeanus]|nr:allantoate permease [Melanogaster broomeanus]
MYKSSAKDIVSIHRRVVSDLVDEDGEQLSWSKLIFRRGPFNPPPAPDAIATTRSVFDDPNLAPHYWPKKDYENIHRFDPAARWTYREEKALVRKIDWKIMLVAAIGFSALNLDHNNINQANSSTFLVDLGLTTNGNYFNMEHDFNLGTTVSHLSFLCAELPSQLISKRVSSLSLNFSSKEGHLFLCAFMTLSAPVFSKEDFYTKTELPIRLTFFWMSMSLCSILASFLAYGTLHLNGLAGQAGWRWLFLIEGSLTLLIGIVTFFNMPPSPTQTKAWFRPKGWFTEREEAIMVNRILRDDPSKGDMHNREGLTLKRLWTAVCDYDLWPVYILGLMFGIPSAPPSTYLTILLRNSGFNTFQTNLLTIPSQAMGILTMFIITVVSESVGERTFIAMMQDLWILPFLVTLYALPSRPNPWAFFAVVTGLLSYPLTLPIQVGWCSRNSGAVASRTVNASLYNMFVQASSIISAQIYVASDSPRYERGNRILIIICCVNLVVLYPGTKAYYVWRNRQRAKIWDAMTPQEKAHYLSTTKDVGNRRLDFRFAH